MKYISSFIILMLFYFQSFSQSNNDCGNTMDLIKEIEKEAEDNTGGFDTDVRLDKVFGESYLEGLGVNSLKFVTDYTGSIRTPTLLFSELDFSNYDLLTARLTFSDKDNIQKITFAPFRLNNRINKNTIDNINNRSYQGIGQNVLSQSKFNISLKNNITTFGFALSSDDSAPSSLKSKGLRYKLFSSGRYCIPEKFESVDEKTKKTITETITSANPGMSKAQLEERIKSAIDARSKAQIEKIKLRNERVADSLLYLYDSLRTRRVFKWSAGYNTQLFSILSSEGSPDIDTTNHHPLKAHNISITGAYGFFNGLYNVSATYNYISSRKNAEKSQDRIAYNGIVLSSSARIYQFLKGENLKTNENFIKSLFIPSFYLGISYEYKYTEGNLKFAENGLQSSRIITPFISVLISPASQFSIGIPITKNRSVTNLETFQFGTVLQYSFKLSNLN